jgi:hypothetical protein
LPGDKLTVIDRHRFLVFLKCLIELVVLVKHISIDRMTSGIFRVKGSKGGSKLKGFILLIGSLCMSGIKPASIGSLTFTSSAGLLNAFCRNSNDF